MGIKKFTDLALKIFMTNRPIDPAGRQHRCVSCSSGINDWDSMCNSCGQNSELEVETTIEDRHVKAK